MERVKERLSVAKKALTALKEAVNRKDLTELERDGAIQRFEFTYEAVWKAVQAYLNDVEKINVSSPRGIVRESFKEGLLNEDEAKKVMDMVAERNLTVHTYNEELAQAIFNRLTGHEAVMEKWLKAVESHLEE